MRVTIFSILVNFGGAIMLGFSKILSACTFENSVGSFFSLVFKISCYSLLAFSFDCIWFKKKIEHLYSELWDSLEFVKKMVALS